jgi:hypothetical protein
MNGGESGLKNIFVYLGNLVQRFSESTRLNLSPHRAFLLRYSCLSSGPQTNYTILTDLKFRGPCILIFSYNNILTPLIDSMISMTNTNCCEYSINTPDDVQ